MRSIYAYSRNELQTSINTVSNSQAESFHTHKVSLGSYTSSQPLLMLQ
jgi:hypothetical protein